MELRLARFHRSADSTLVQAFVLVRFTLLRAGEQGPQGRATYGVTLTVRDAASTLRGSHSRVRSVAAVELDGARYAVERLEFTVPPGSYVCEVTVTDSASGLSAGAAAKVAAFPRQPLLSDIVLAADVQVAGWRGDARRSRELAIGEAVLRDPGWPPSDESRASLQYFAEVYGNGEGIDSLDIRAWVEDSTERRLRQLPTALIEGQPGHRFAAGSVSLRGLPPGGHRLVVIARSRGETSVRRIELPNRDLAGPSRSPAQDPFTAATEAQLDSLYAPLVYVMQQDERGIYATLPTTGRRDFLRTFWVRRDPTPGTLENEALTEFYERVALANRDFREGGAGAMPGWRTDRGRVLILHGIPDEVLRRPQPADALPYQAWKYTRGKPVRFVFVDLTRFGDYVLVWSNDLHEVGRPNWRQLLGPRAVEEVLRF